MAYGYAHSTGRVGVCAVVPGPGLLNASAALLTAFGCEARVFCLAGQIPSHGIDSGIGYPHEFPGQLAMARTVTKWAARIDDPIDTPELVCTALDQMYTGRPRPVALEMAVDLMSAENSLQPSRRVVPTHVQLPNLDDIKSAAKILANATLPIIAVGGGARDATEQVSELAHLLQAPVISHRQGKGILSDRDYLSLSFPAAHRIWSEADVVLMVGTRMKYPQLYWGMNGLSKIKIDVDPDELDRIQPPTVGIVSDAAVALDELIAQIDRICPRRSSIRDQMIALRKETANAIAEIQPQVGFLQVIREELPDSGFFIDDVTQVGFTSWFAFPTYRPRSFVTAGYQGTLGHSLATAIGVQIAHPSEKVLHVIGDGGFLFNSQELATAVKHQLGIVTVLFRDDKFGNVYRDQAKLFDGRTTGAHLHNPDFVRLVESYGAAAMRVSTARELRYAIRDAFRHNSKVPTVIEVPVQEMPSPWKYILMPRIRK